MPQGDGFHSWCIPSQSLALLSLTGLLGYSAWIGKPVTKNAVLVDILEALGAVLYVKTNVPQALVVRSFLGSRIRLSMFRSGPRRTIIYLEGR